MWRTWIELSIAVLRNSKNEWKTRIINGRAWVVKIKVYGAGTRGRKK